MAEVIEETTESDVCDDTIMVFTGGDHNGTMKKLSPGWPMKGGYDSEFTNKCESIASREWGRANGESGFVVFVKNPTPSFFEAASGIGLTQSRQVTADDEVPEFMKQNR